MCVYTKSFSKLGLKMFNILHVLGHKYLISPALFNVATGKLRSHIRLAASALEEVQIPQHGIPSQLF